MVLRFPLTTEQKLLLAVLRNQQHPPRQLLPQNLLGFFSKYSLLQLFCSDHLMIYKFLLLCLSKKYIKQIFRAFITLALCSSIYSLNFRLTMLQLCSAWTKIPNKYQLYALLWNNKIKLTIITIMIPADSSSLLCLSFTLFPLSSN